MHLAPYHRELDQGALEEFIRKNPLGLITTSIAHPGIETLQVSHVPWVLTPGEGGKPGKLRGHMARANPQVKAMLEAGGRENQALPDNVLVLFNAPVHSYVTPKYYVATKPTTGKVVPTWDYAAVQVYGKLRCYGANNAEATDFLTTLLEDLSEQSERDAGNEKPWKVSDAPTSYVDTLKKAIVGIEIDIDHLEGRFKLSQEMKGGDHQGVIDGFRAIGTAQGDEMARMVEERGKIRDAKAAAS